MIQLSAQALRQQRVQDFREDSPLAHCLPSKSGLKQSDLDLFKGAQLIATKGSQSLTGLCVHAHRNNQMYAGPSPGVRQILLRGVNAAVWMGMIDRKKLQVVGLKAAQSAKLLKGVRDERPVSSSDVHQR